MKKIIQSLLTLLAILLIVNSATAQEARVWIPGWQATEALSIARAGGAIVEANGIIYAIGGIDGKDFLDSTEYTRIESTGHLSTWTASTKLTEPRGFFNAVAHNGYIYAIGGGNGPAGHNLLKSVERTKIQPDGSLGPWEVETTTLNLPRRCVKVILYNNRIYAFGGFGGTLLDTIESAPILANGHLGSWRVESNTLTLPRYVHAGKKSDKSIIVTGGHAASQGAGLTDVEWAKLDDKTDTLSWQKGNDLITGRYGHSVFILGNTLYAMGGLEKINYLRSIEKSKLDPVTGEPGPWEATNPMSVTLANFSVITYNNFVYVLGGTNQDGYYNHVEFTSTNERGDIGFWGDKKQAAQYERWESPKREPSTSLTLENYGIVIESITAGSYAYLYIETPTGKEWIAGEVGHYPMNSQVEYTSGVMMQDFKSDTLQRTFPSIRFVSKINTLGSPH